MEKQFCIHLKTLESETVYPRIIEPWESESEFEGLSLTHAINYSVRYQSTPFQ